MQILRRVKRVVLFHTEVRWLARGNMINRLFELRNEVTHFLQLHNKNLYEKWIDKKFILKVSYLGDIFEELNILNKKLQGKEKNVTGMHW